MLLGQDECGGRGIQQTFQDTPAPLQGVLPHRRPLYSRFVTLNSRLETFNTWPVQLPQTPKAMASAGFFYTGYGDKVQCFSSGCGLEKWDPEDDPELEHKKWYPDCFFVRMKDGEAPPLDTQDKDGGQISKDPVCKICLTESAKVRQSIYYFKIIYNLYSSS